jgi:Uma2 family endonuclease
MTNQLIELVDGRIEVLEMPKKPHQKRARAFADALDAYCRSRGITGETVLAAYPVRVASGRFREPDVVFAFDPARLGDDFGERPDLVVEVVSKDRDRDLIHKRLDYAVAGIREYWIADPQEARVIVLELREGQYVESGRFGVGELARSVVVAGFETNTDILIG